MGRLEPDRYLLSICILGAATVAVGWGALVMISVLCIIGGGGEARLVAVLWACSFLVTILLAFRFVVRRLRDARFSGLHALWILTLPAILFALAGGAYDSFLHFCLFTNGSKLPPLTREISAGALLAVLLQVALLLGLAMLPSKPAAAARKSTPH